MYKYLTSVVFACLMALIGAAGAQDFPNRPVTLIIPFAAGGPQDTLARIFTPRMSEVLGQQIVIENVGGAGGTIGSKRVAAAAPDGYTMLLASVGTHAQSQTLYKKPPYNAVTDFTPVAFLGETPIALTVRANLPVNNLKEFVAYAKANQDKMSFGSAGAGSATHLGCVVMNTAMGTNKITHVPYKGTGPAMQDLHGGRIDFLCEIIATAKPQIESGKVKGLAIMTKSRSPVLPDLPTGIEQGVNVEAYTWSALFMPKGAPAEAVKKINAAAVAAITTPAVQQRLQGLGMTVATKDRQSPDYLGTFVKSEIGKWAAPIKASGASAD